LEAFAPVHWLERVALRSGHATDALQLDARMAVGDAWAKVCAVTGLDDETLASLIADRYKMAVADFHKAMGAAIRLLPEETARRLHVFPLRADHQRLVLATSDPTRTDIDQEISFATSRETRFEIGAPAQIENAIEAHYEAVDIARGEPAVPVEPSGPLHVLLVDDDTVSRSLAKVLLQRASWRVTEAVDGLDALEKLASGQACSVVILDLGMPRLGGRETLQRIRAERSTARLPVVVLTGSDDDRVEAELLDLGADDYLRKPIDAARFLSRIKAVLRRNGVQV
jgi:CheY-like chemotaxis protein